MNDLTRGLTLVLLATCFVAAASATPRTIELPGETAKLRESTLPGYTVASQKCLICHSVDYINYQPPGMTEAQWTAEMMKMQHLYGAPIDEQEIKLLATYLATMYGDAKSTE